MNDVGEEATRGPAVPGGSSIRQRGNACSSRRLRADPPSASQTLRLLCSELIPAPSCCLVTFRAAENTGSCADFITRGCVSVSADTHTHTHAHFLLKL